MTIFLTTNLNLDGLIYLILAIIFGPAILFFIIAVLLMLKERKRAAKVFWILGFVYIIISLGLCGSMMM